MTRLDERLRLGLEEIAEPADPAGVTEHVLREAGRRRVLRRAQAGFLTVAVVAGTAAGVWALSRVFMPDQSSRIGADTAAVGNGLIAFSGQTHHLFLVRPDGTHIRQITFGDVTDDDPDWSPDGRRIAFQRWDQVTREIGLAVLDVETGEVRILTPPEMSIDRPDWSPDGERIVFAGFGEGVTSGIYVVNADGTGLRSLTGDRFFAPGMSVWSPDGSTIAFSGNLPDSIRSWDVYLVNADGSGLRNITQTPDGERSESPIGWLPNGNLLVERGPGVVSSGPGLPMQAGEWLEMTPEGEVVRIIWEGAVNTPEAPETPSISPDGRFVVLATEIDGPQNVWFMDIETGELTQVTTEGGFAPDWQPVPAEEEATEEPAVEETDEPSPETEATEEPEESPEAGRDLGLGFSLCNLQTLGGIDFLGDGSAGRAWTGARVRDNGSCPDPSENSLVAADFTGDGLADSWWGPIEYCVECAPYAATDLDADGDQELVLLAQHSSTPQFLLFSVQQGASGQRDLRPIKVAPPGNPQGDLPAGEPASFSTGGDAGFAGAVACEGYPGAPVLVVAWSYRPIEGPGSETSEIHVTRLALEEDGALHVIESADFTQPTGDPLPYPFGSSGRACGVDFARVA